MTCKYLIELVELPIRDDDGPVVVFVVVVCACVLGPVVFEVGDGPSGPREATAHKRSQVWSLTQFYSVDFSQSKISVKTCVFNKRTIKVCVSCC